MTISIALAYTLGIVLGLIAARVSSIATIWPAIVRAQVLAAALSLSIVVVWQIDDLDAVLWPAMLSGVMVIMTLAAWVANRKKPARLAHASLQTWASNSNTAYFAIPIAAALAGPGAAAAAVLMDRISTPLYAFWVWALRKEAPRQQRKRSSLIDQAPVLAMLVGLALKLTGPAPDWTNNITLIAAPVLAVSGAAMFIGSVLHPSQRFPARPGLNRWAMLIGIRITLMLSIALFAPSPELAIAAVLCALSIPAFGAPQAATVYGYKDSIVAAGARYGWPIGAIGLVVAVVMTN